MSVRSTNVPPVFVTTPLTRAAVNVLYTYAPRAFDADGDIPNFSLTVAPEGMTIDGGTAIILAYVLVSIGVIIASLLAARPIGWFIDRLRERRHGQRASQRREE